MASMNPLPDEIMIPSGKPVMIDGRFRAEEWHDAARQAVSGAADIYFKQADEFVFICIHFLQGRFGLVDLYVAEGGAPPVNLHASAKLGERVLQGATWSPWMWWNNVEWVANVSRVESLQAGTFLPEEVRTFQIRRSRFGGQRWRVFFVLTSLMAEGQETIAFPSQTNDLDTDHWLSLRLSGGELYINHDGL